ncbi:MAG: chemotaxis protein CheW [Fuerstiella sp.]|jgi:purine-binding chemotaxis protein CheW|nr:chemotaxis protein CheW [Fuerstiella sp.]
MASDETRQFCCFLLDDMLFGIDVGDVQEVLRDQHRTRVPLASPMVHGLINLRGQIVTVLDLRHCLKLPSLTDERRPAHVIVRTRDEPMSFLVDEIGDVLSVRESDFVPAPETLSGVAVDLICGTYKLEQRLILVLNTQQIADHAVAGRSQKQA